MDVTLTTRRLVLRQPVRSDAGRITRLLNHFAVAGNLSSVPYPYAESHAHAWLDRKMGDLPADEITFVVQLPGEGVIGVCGFDARPGGGGAGFGYWLGEPFWNRGFASEAAQAALDWYLQLPGSEEVRSGIFHFNKASMAVQKKLGFTEIGSGMLHCLARQEELRHIDTQLTRARWTERRQGATAKELT